MLGKIAGLLHITSIKESLSFLVFSSVSRGRKAHYALRGDKWLFYLIRCGMWNSWNVMTFSSNRFAFAVRLSVAGAFYMIINSAAVGILSVFPKKLFRTSDLWHNLHQPPFEAWDVIISLRHKWRPQIKEWVSVHVSCISPATFMANLWKKKKSDNSQSIKYETESHWAASLYQFQLKCEQRCCLIIQEEQTWQVTVLDLLSQILSSAATSKLYGQVSPA